MHEALFLSLVFNNPALKESKACGCYSMGTLPLFIQKEEGEQSDIESESSNELNVSFGYKCSITQTADVCESEISTEIQIQESNFLSRSSSFSHLSGAALSANYTWANTNICNGVISGEILPGLDSPNSFRMLTSSPSLSRLDLLSSSSPSNMSRLSRAISTDNEMLEGGRCPWKSTSAPTQLETSSFLNAMDVKTAGGAAGEDRVQAVCSEENGWLFCGVYDGFNGRDAADYLAVTLYENIALKLHWLEWAVKQGNLANVPALRNSLKCTPGYGIAKGSSSVASDTDKELDVSADFSSGQLSSEAFRIGVLECLTDALAQAESDFMYNVQQEMKDRPELVSIGSCVLAMLLHGTDMYILNLGDSRAVLATSSASGSSTLQAIQLTETHTVDNKKECRKILADHPDDPSPIIIGGRVKGKLKVTRAFGVGYLKKKKMNNALMGILQVQNLDSPPYVYSHPFAIGHSVSENDLFVVLGSDGLFDFFSNHEVVQLVHEYIQENPFGDPAKHLVEQLVLRAAENAGFSTEELMSIPVGGRRRKYHDDVTVIVINLGNKQRTSKASTSF